MELGKTSYVILGMLKLGRRTGYEIKSLVDVSTRFFWAASYGQIYPELARLEQLGLVRGEEDRSNGRRRKAYELTATGERALHAWLTSDDPLHIELRHEGALKFFFSDALKRDEQLSLVRRTRQTHEHIAEQLRAIEPESDEGEPRAPLQTLEFGIAYQEFLAEWCARMERRLARGTSEQRR
ncbi:MAG: PadR family transcriptional regulator [Solirubrobacterales bacterium]